MWTTDKVKAAINIKQTKLIWRNTYRFFKKKNIFAFFFSGVGERGGVRYMWEGLSVEGHNKVEGTDVEEFGLQRDGVLLASITNVLRGIFSAYYVHGPVFETRVFACCHDLFERLLS